MPTRFIVAKDQLPGDIEERYDALHDYFCELKAWTVDTGAEWEISVSRPDRAEAYVDPKLGEGLAWYSRTFEPVDVSEIAFAVHRSRLFQLSLNDSWTLSSWSLWLNGRSPAEVDVTILHVDDHDDLMTPRLLSRGDLMLDALTGEAVRISAPPTVDSAIRSGAIGIGSFVAPFVRSTRRVDVRHLCASRYAIERPGNYRIAPMDAPDNLLHPSDVRPGVRLERAQSDDEPDHRYSVTDDPDSWVRDLRTGPVLLHVDMDYFNNRFNWSSDWEQNQRHDPSLSEVLRSIERMMQSLRRHQVLSRIEDVAIALSPGFFPAELWQPSIELIERLVIDR